MLQPRQRSLEIFQLFHRKEWCGGSQIDHQLAPCLELPECLGSDMSACVLDELFRFDVPSRLVRRCWLLLLSAASASASGLV